MSLIRFKGHLYRLADAEMLREKKRFVYQELDRALRESRILLKMLQSASDMANAAKLPKASKEARNLVEKTKELGIDIWGARDRVEF